jgi:hypothetical protein
MNTLLTVLYWWLACDLLLGAMLLLAYETRKRSAIRRLRRDMEEWRSGNNPKEEDKS